MRVPILGAALCAALLSAPDRAVLAGPSICGPYAIIAAQLRARFGELPLYRWPSPSGTHVVEFWRSEGGRTVSILARDAGGVACIIATGRDAERIAMPPAGKGAGA